jgi:hypothetical protein
MQQKTKKTLTTLTLLLALTISVLGQKNEEKLVREAFEGWSKWERYSQ